MVHSQAGEALSVSDFDFSLPPHLIAQQPLAQRTDSRLLHVSPTELRDLHFPDIEQLIGPQDLVVLNDTRVMKARLYGQKPTGGRVEVLIERILAPDQALAMVRTSHTPQAGQTFLFGTGAQRVTATVQSRQENFFLLSFDQDLSTTLDAMGHLPLPPYIERGDDPVDEIRYQTVYAREPGAVAAPTAGLHFSEALLRRLSDRGAQLVWITLHVGAGTFQPVRTEHLDAHRMHSERYVISEESALRINSARAQGRRVLAVGTTSLRALESAAQDGQVRAGSHQTSLFIRPGYRFQIVERLLTNFHLPRSTLLMLVSAFAGPERIRSAYTHAIDQEYRFFSYGDAMLLEGQQHPAKMGK